MVGTWNVTAPDGAQSVRANRSILGDNTEYVRANLNLDHYWGTGVGAQEDGHHRFVQTPRFVGGTTPNNPDLATGMDGVFYAKVKTNAESPNNEDVQPFFSSEATVNAVNNIPQFMQIPGMRACAVFNGITGASQYVHNVDPALGVGIVLVSIGGFPGGYRVNFTRELPTSDYMIFGGSYSTTTTTTFAVSFLAGLKTTTSCGFITLAGANNTLTRSDQVWIMVIGG